DANVGAQLSTDEQQGVRTTDSVFSRDRFINGVINDVIADRGFGVSQFRAAGPVDIRRNTISGTGYGTIESSFNISSVTGVTAAVRITDNVLRPGPAPNGFGVGIEVNGE